MRELEFQFVPHYCGECVFNYKGLAWGEISLVCKPERIQITLQQLIFPVVRGSTLHGSRLFSYMEQLRVMFMSTTRGLPHGIQ